MAVIVGKAEFDVLAKPVIVSFVDFDVRRARPVVVSFVEFDSLAPPTPDAVIPAEPGQDTAGGGRARRSSVASKSSPAPAPTHYHSNAYEQLERAAAAELADEEIVLTFLLELALLDILPP